MKDWVYWLNIFNAYGWFVLIVLLERAFPTRRTPFFNKGWVFDLFHTYEPWVRAFIIGGAVQLAAPYAVRLPYGGLLAQQNIWVNLLALVLISEVTFYFLHIWMHKSKWLWEFHRVHHSSTSYYSFMTSRFHIVDMVIFNLPYVCIASWMNAKPEALMAYAVFQGFVDRYGHSNINGPRFDNVIGYVFGSPHFHAWHHSVEPEAHDKNFSRDFVFMDRIFGTAYYPKDKVPQVFGDPEYSNNYVVQQVYPFWSIARMIGAKFMPSSRTVQSPPVDAQGTGQSS